MWYKIVRNIYKSYETKLFDYLKNVFTTSSNNQGFSYNMKTRHSVNPHEITIYRHFAFSRVDQALHHVCPLEPHSLLCFVTYSHVVITDLNGKNHCILASMRLLLFSWGQVTSRARRQE